MCRYNAQLVVISKDALSMTKRGDLTSCNNWPGIPKKG